MSAVLDRALKRFPSQRTAETLADSKLFETSGVEEVEFRLWGVHTFDQGRWVRTQWFSKRSEALAAAGLSE